MKVKSTASRSKRLALACFFAVAVAVIAAGCGSSGGSSSSSAETPTTSGESTTATTAADTSAKPTGTPIKIGSICSCSGVQASVLGSAGVAMEAWAQNVNAKGGLNGHPVELFLEDDGGDPAKSQQAVKKLVEQDKVTAIVSDYSLVDETWQEYVTEKGIPVVGGLMVETTFLTNPNFFATGAQPPTSLLALTEALEQKGKKSLRVLYCAESPICALSEKLAQLAAAAAGGKVDVSGAKVSSTAPDYTATCLDAKNAGVEAVLLGVNALVMSRIMNSCIQQSYTPTVTATTEGSGISFAEGSGFEGGLTSGPTAYFTDEDIPGTAEFREAMETYESGYLESSTMSDNAVEAWAAGKLFEAAAEAAKLGPSSTSADVVNGLYKLKEETLEGLVAPITYTKGQPFVTPCAFVHEVQEGAFVLQGGEPSCAPEAAFKTLVGSLSQLSG